MCCSSQMKKRVKLLQLWWNAEKIVKFWTLCVGVKIMLLAWYTLICLNSIEEEILMIYMYDLPFKLVLYCVWLYDSSWCCWHDISVGFKVNRGR